MQCLAVLIEHRVVGVY